MSTTRIIIAVVCRGHHNFRLIECNTVTLEVIFTKVTASPVDHVAGAHKQPRSVPCDVVHVVVGLVEAGSIRHGGGVVAWVLAGKPAAAAAAAAAAVLSGHCQ
jgi:hypothetical protein